MRYVIFATLTALAYSFGYIAASKPETPPQAEILGQTWCLVAHYPSMKEYGQAEPLPEVMVDVHSRGVTVYARCAQDGIEVKL